MELWLLADPLGCLALYTNYHLVSAGIGYSDVFSRFCGSGGRGTVGSGSLSTRAAPYVDMPIPKLQRSGSKSLARENVGKEIGEPHYDGYAGWERDLGRICRKIVAAVIQQGLYM